MHTTKPNKPAPDFTSRAYWDSTIKMSLSKFFILCVLYRRPMHGYEITRAVERTTNGCCSPTEGTIYPVLREFESGGYVTAHEEIAAGRKRKVYTLTDKGREAFQVAVEVWMNVTSCLLDTEQVLAENGGRHCC
ncbi:MAG: PadR family transcriptional regulator [Aquisalimonadaceae bacterium]